ncbi:MAG TPA: molybdopterin-dependent oxidoreductase [bacterium]|nr:molybdopterin-dependent oxidoreductase [bacterium]
MKIQTTCPFCGCGCGMLLEVDQGVVLAAAPQKSHPVSRGTLCIKGWNGHQIIHHPHRLTHPLIKVQDHLEPVSWKKALAFAADKITALQQAHGRASLGVIGSVKTTNEASYLLGKLARAVLQTPHLDVPVRYDHAPSLRVLKEQSGYANATASLAEIEKAGAILVIGADAKAQSARAGSLLLQSARRGVAVVQIDPRQHEHSRFYRLQLQPHPGTDLALINALIRVILEEGWQAPGITGISRLREDGLDRFSPEYVESVCGIPHEQVKEAAALLGRASSLLILFGSGITQQANGTANVRALWNLALLTGNIGRAGGGLIPLLGSNNSQGAVDTGLMTEWGPGQRDLHEASARHPLESAWGCTLPAKPGLTLQEMLQHAGGRIRGLYVVGENLAWSAPDCGVSAAALDKLDFLMVQDLFLTETAAKADVVLPAASFAEQEGSYTNLERRLQRVRPAIAPLGESRSDLEIIPMLASALGAAWPLRSAAEVFQEMQEVIPCYKNLTWQDLDQPGGVIWPAHHEAESNGLYRQLLGDRQGAFTEVTAGAPFAEEPDEAYPFALFTGRPLFHRRSGTLVTRSFTLDKEDAVATVEVNNEDARALKLRSGWQVVVKTRRGQVRRTVVISRAVPPRTLFLPIHHRDGLTQSLMPSTLEPESGIPQMKLCAAKLEMV